MGANMVRRLAANGHQCVGFNRSPQIVEQMAKEKVLTASTSIEDLLSAPAVKLLIRKAGARSADMAAELAKHVGIEGDITYSTNNGLIEIVPLGINKATGIAELARPQGITDDDWVAFGDMPNDVPMLLRAGHGVAMGNAHPDVLAVADEVTTPNTDDGVARVLERWWL